MPERETGMTEAWPPGWNTDRIELLPVETIPVAAVRPSDSPRLEGEDSEHVGRLAGIVTGLPPIVVHRPTMRVVDGMHRLGAAVLRGETRIAARFFEGSAEDAFVLAVGLNTVHGLPLSPADRRAAATRIVGTHPHWSDRTIAAATGLAYTTVASIRGHFAENPRAAVREAATAGEHDGPAGLARFSGSEQAFQELQRDPSLRYTEAGRDLLRLLDAHAADADRWTWLVAGVPVHRRTEVAHAARGCAQSWLRFARELEERDPERRRPERGNESEAPESPGA
ncbi:ParB/RepB/Spo0J family partition protein [Amycolatopsis samaneae]|uniref:ParB/RepB/Spo0J family partition protein n=1 Tax=Amycolatopsis samaneae TaxID=664691 RepID=A0ABW5GF93_9PSEU